MTQRKIVVALGGNAILSKDASAQAQMKAVKDTVKQLIEFVKNGDQLIISHGNGPQVGNLLIQQANSDSKQTPAMPLDTAGAMSQGQIGYWMQNAFNEVLAQEGIDLDVATIVTQTIVDKNDAAFENPTKPIGPFYTEEEAKKQQTENPSAHFVEDSGRGWRRVVPSPIPVGIKEANVIKQLVENNVITISAGGGGVPVVKEDGKLTGVEAVIDKDFASEKVAELVEADMLIILTAVDNVYVNYNKPDQKKLEKVSVSELEGYIKEEQFAKGSMLPKIQAAIEYVNNRPDSKAIITSLDNVKNLLANDAGTIITKN
ncbi:carbamate kinase [Companilactobacillus sp. RD055328]|uniref:carbamate kinase n=1 Tax=Companilactobacillus sp. RD055328 TaxID=2916634 RepID=UPI001FC84F92|nr:carbamate kinase [Companilactobacillus sp. RD055328]GKQ42116.1 carbamate kinase [Companilactobacillus sp. RD055328]